MVLKAYLTLSNVLCQRCFDTEVLCLTYFIFIHNFHWKGFQWYKHWDITHKQRETLGFQTQKTWFPIRYMPFYTDESLIKCIDFSRHTSTLVLTGCFIVCVYTCAVYTKLALVINKEKCAYDLWSLKVIVAVLVFSQPILEFIFVSYFLLFPWYILGIIFFCGWMDSDSDISILRMISYNKLHFLYTPTICTNWCSDAPWCL